MLFTHTHTLTKSTPGGFASSNTPPQSRTRYSRYFESVWECFRIYPRFRGPGSRVLPEQRNSRDGLSRPPRGERKMCVCVCVHKNAAERASFLSYTKPLHGIYYYTLSKTQTYDYAQYTLHIQRGRGCGCESVRRDCASARAVCLLESRCREREPSTRSDTTQFSYVCALCGRAARARVRNARV